MKGLLLKTLRESYVMILLFAVGLFVVERLLTHILPEVEGQVTDLIGQLPFAQTMLSALLGIDVGTKFSAQIFQSILWVHPVILALVWGFEIIFCTRYPAGEIDRGTIDVLLGLPVSRRAVFVSETVVWLGAGVLLLAAQWCGFALGAGAISADIRPSALTVIKVLANFACVYIAVGGGALFVASLCARRGTAVATVFGVLLASFLLDFLAQFWEPAKNLSFLSVLDYYRPAQIIADGTLPMVRMIVLLAVGAGAWIVASLIVARRSICTT